MDFGLATGATHAGFRVCNQVLEVGNAIRNQRQEAQLHCCWIAARIGDDARTPDLCTVDLGQSIYRFPHQVRGRVLDAVPFFPRRDVLDAEIRGNVDHFDAGIDQRLRLMHGDGIRRCEEHHVALLECGLRRCAEIDVDAPAQARKHCGDGSACLLARSDGRNLTIRMLREQAQQLDARVAGAAHHSDPEHCVRHRWSMCRNSAESL
jgi:hypothetical protein